MNRKVITAIVVIVALALVTLAVIAAPGIAEMMLSAHRVPLH